MTGVDPDTIEQELGNFWRNLYKLEKGFVEVPAAKKIASKVSNASPGHLVAMFK